MVERKEEWSRFANEQRQIRWQDAAPEPEAVPARRPVSATRAAIIVAAVVAIALTVVVAGQFPRRHPLLPALRFHAPRQALSAVQSHQHLKLRLPSSARLGSHTDFTGEATDFPGRRVTLLGSRNGGPWTPLDRARIRPDGHFSLSLRYTRRGRLHLRLNYPNGDVAEGSVTVR